MKINEVKQMANDVVLNVEHLQKKFGKFEALKDVNLQVKQGEVLASSDRMAPENPQPFG